MITLFEDGQQCLDTTLLNRNYIWKRNNENKSNHHSHIIKEHLHTLQYQSDTFKNILKWFRLQARTWVRAGVDDRVHVPPVMLSVQSENLFDKLVGLNSNSIVGDILSKGNHYGWMDCLLCNEWRFTWCSRW